MSYDLITISRSEEGWVAALRHKDVSKPNGLEFWAPTLPELLFILGAYSFGNEF
jgi:hypothetical protein